MRYKPSLKPALRSLSFTIDPGMTVAVVGRTGAGKSSLYQLLTGFRTANRGKVLIDDFDISKLDLVTLRNEINVVLQQHFVIASDSIKDNLDPYEIFSDRELYDALSESAFFNSFNGRKEEVTSEKTLNT